MSKMPRGSKLIYNPSSAAPGFITKNVLSLPGVPSILNSMIFLCTGNFITYKYFALVFDASFTMPVLALRFVLLY